MTKSLVRTALWTVLVIVCAAGFSFGRSWSLHRSPMKTTEIHVANKAKVGDNLILEPGSYRMQLDPSSQSPEVVFYKEGKEVGRTQAKAVSEERKNPSTEMSLVQQGDLGVVTEIRPGGWKEKLEFGGSNVTDKPTQ